jgi:hypothetical protein
MPERNFPSAKKNEIDLKEKRIIQLEQKGALDQKEAYYVIVVDDSSCQRSLLKKKSPI